MRTGRTERWLPLAYFAAAISLVVVLLPSVLRQQPPEQNHSAALSPDAPPDDEQQTIIANLNRASSGTAGSGSGTGEGDPLLEATTTTTRPTVACRGFGNPPRQIESVYAGTCAPPCPTNAGATHRNVTRDEVRVGFKHGAADASQVGPIPSSPDGRNENAADRTYRVLQQYFNQRYQFCGRYLRLVQLGEGADSGSAAEVARSEAAAADENYRVFAATSLNFEYCDELTRRDLVAFCNPGPSSRYVVRDGRMWGWMTDFTMLDRFAAELLCKQFKDKPATLTDDVTLQGRTRRVGAMYWASPSSGLHTTTELVDAYRATCGGTIEDTVEFEAEASQDETAQAGAAIARFKSAGVTTVVLSHNGTGALALMAVASSQAYYPEWVIPSPYGLDFNHVGFLFPADQARHVVGFSQWEIPRNQNAHECYVAYRSVDPSQNPDDATCRLMFHTFVQIANGIQAAGPRLTPETFRDGLFRIGRKFGLAKHATGGGYGPGDFTYIDDFGIIWWDANATDPHNNRPGAYRWVNDGSRYQLGQIPTTPIRWFDEGIAGVSE